MGTLGRFREAQICLYKNPGAVATPRMGMLITELDEMNKGVHMNTTLIIDNKAVNSEGEAVFERRHPVTDKVVTTAAAASIGDAGRAAESAARAFQTWSQLGPPNGAGFC